jgi:hypothetical protein
MDGDTQEMKNKDGIVIKPGQVWLVGTLNDKHEIIATHMDKPISFCEKAESRYGTLTQLTGPGQSQLIKSHDGADLEAARAEGWEVWVEGMESPDMSRVTVFEIKLSRAWETHWTTNPLKGLYTYRYKLKAEEPEPVAADESCHVLTQFVIDEKTGYEILENAYWEFDAMRKRSETTERDAFKRVARMAINATVNHLLSSLK